MEIPMRQNIQNHSDSGSKYFFKDKGNMPSLFNILLIFSFAFNANLHKAVWSFQHVKICFIFKTPEKKSH